MKKYIVVHDGIFHADDVLAFVLVKTITNTDAVMRSRNPEIIKNAYYRLDVGEKYNPATNDYDHHQDITLPCAAQLVWNELGGAYIRIKFPQVHNTIDIVDYVNKNLLNTISALDTKYSTHVQEHPINGYYHFSEIIKDFNREGGEDQQIQFILASKFAEAVIDNLIVKAIKFQETCETISNKVKLAEYATLYEKGFSYNEFRWEEGKTAYVKDMLVMPQTDYTWSVISMDTEKFHLASCPKELYPSLIFAHKGGFFCKFAKKEDAVKFAVNRSVAKEQAVVQWQMENL